jgi:hypothetical protein
MAASTSAECRATAVADSLKLLSAGAVTWLGLNLDFFNPFAAGAQLAGFRKTKAALELRLLPYCREGVRREGLRREGHCREGHGQADDRLADIDALVRKLWRSRDFQRLVTSRADNPAYYGLIYVAMAPAGFALELRDPTLAMLRAEGYLSGAGQTPFLRMQTRFFADKAGLAHEIESYPELIEQSTLVTLPAAGPVTLPQAYGITHESFFLSDYGRQPPALAADRLARAVTLVSGMLSYCAAHDMWDLAAELVITLSCLGVDPVSSPSGAAGIRSLARAQRPDGAIPGRSAAQQADASAGPAEFFNSAYHTTLLVALIPYIAARGRYPRGEGI